MDLDNPSGIRVAIDRFGLPPRAMHFVSKFEEQHGPLEKMPETGKAEVRQIMQLVDGGTILAAIVAQLLGSIPDSELPTVEPITGVDHEPVDTSEIDANQDTIKAAEDILACPEDEFGFKVMALSAQELRTAIEFAGDNEVYADRVIRINTRLTEVVAGAVPNTEG